jgi:hypothetical protein
MMQLVHCVSGDFRHDHWVCAFDLARDDFRDDVPLRIPPEQALPAGAMSGAAGTIPLERSFS